MAEHGEPTAAGALPSLQRDRGEEAQGDTERRERERASHQTHDPTHSDGEEVSETDVLLQVQATEPAQSGATAVGPHREAEAKPEVEPEDEAEPQPEPEREAEGEPSPSSSGFQKLRARGSMGALPRQRSSERQRDERLRLLLQLVEGQYEPIAHTDPSGGEHAPGPGEDGEDLTRTPSVQQDVEAAAQANGSAPPQSQLARAQRMRMQCRLLDADIAEAKAQLLRAALLRGPSPVKLQCDADCVVGGCGAEFAEEEGVLCGGCRLFLCHTCFGATVVIHECQQGGRFDSEVRAGDAVSEPGSLPCPRFPQECSCGHIPLHMIQRAMLHPHNRGRDGAEEDVHSSGHSAHKVHLQARRRWAEAEAQKTSSSAGAPLVRTLTERVARRATPTLSGGIDTAVLADKLDELEQLKIELLSRPAAEAIPAHLRRTCVQCHGDFASFEGGECRYFSNRVRRHSHFLCALCYGGYVPAQEVRSYLVSHL